MLFGSNQKVLRNCFIYLQFCHGKSKITRMAFHLLINDEIKKYKKTLVSQLCLYLAGLQKKWYVFVSPLNYTCFCQVFTSIADMDLFCHFYFKTRKDRLLLAALWCCNQKRITRKPSPCAPNYYFTIFHDENQSHQNNVSTSSTL